MEIRFRRRRPLLIILWSAGGRAEQYKTYCIYHRHTVCMREWTGNTSRRMRETYSPSVGRGRCRVTADEEEKLTEDLYEIILISNK